MCELFLCCPAEYTGKLAQHSKPVTGLSRATYIVVSHQAAFFYFSSVFPENLSGSINNIIIECQNQSFYTAIVHQSLFCHFSTECQFLPPGGEINDWSDSNTE